MNPFEIFFLYTATAVIGVFLEMFVRILHHRLTQSHFKEHHFTLGKYFFYLLFPIIGLFVIYTQAGLNVVQVFVIFSAVGTVLEWLVGFTYYEIVGVRLWTYHKYAITKYTSFLSIPLWGLFGVLLWLLAKTI